MTTKIASTNWFDIAADSVEVKTAPEPRIVELDEATTGTTEPLRIPDITSEPAALDTTGDGTDTKTRRTPHWRRAVSLVVSTAVVTGWFMMLRPTSLGGPASILVVRGVSMQPTMDYGDVIIAHARSAYEVGDIIAFRVPESEIGAGTVVIHRIIGGDAASGFQTKGDSNSEPDEWRPLPTDILGAARWRIPLLGRLLSVLRSTPGIALIAGLLASLLVLFGLERPEYRRTRRKPDTPPIPSVAVDPPPHEDPLDDIITPEIPITPLLSADADPLDDIISLRLATDDDEVVGEYWGDDLGYLKGVLRQRSPQPVLFDDDLEEVAARPA